MDPEQLRAVIRSRGLTQQQVADHLGVDQSRVSRLLSGMRTLTAAELVRLGELLGTAPQAAAPDTLGGLPIIGQVAAGHWREAVRDPAGMMPRPHPSIPPRAFALLVEGDSMDEEVEDGDVVIVDPDDRALYPKRYYVVLNAAGEATFKQYRDRPARLVPRSTNKAHREIVVSGPDPFEIVGRVIWRAARM